MCMQLTLSGGHVWDCSTNACSIAWWSSCDVSAASSYSCAAAMRVMSLDSWLTWSWSRWAHTSVTTLNESETITRHKRHSELMLQLLQLFGLAPGLPETTVTSQCGPGQVFAFGTGKHFSANPLFKAMSNSYDYCSKNTCKKIFWLCCSF